MFPGTRVLIVEDEALIAMLIEDYLDDLGCEIVGTASRLEDGLRKATDLQIDVAVLDINLAGTLSYPIAEVLSARNIPFIFASGYGLTALPQGLTGTPVLPKPYEQKTLVDALIGVLGAQAP